MSNEKEIRRIIENWAAAVRKGDMKSILAHHSNDIVMFDVPPPFQSIGIEAYEKTWDIFYRNTKPNIFDFHNLDIIADENVAFCIATMKCADKSGGGEYLDLDFRLTVGLKKINGEWTIVHEHHSIPAE